MDKNKTKILVAGLAVGLTLPLSATAAMAASGESAPETPPDSAVGVPDGAKGPQDGPRAGQGPDRKARSEALAAELGVSAPELREATKAAREAVRDSDIDVKEDKEAAKEAFQVALAQQLDVSISDLEDAHLAVFTSHVTSLVEDGRLSQEAANEAVEAFESGDRKAAGDILRDARLQNAVDDGKLTQEEAQRIRENGPRQHQGQKGPHAGRSRGQSPDAHGLGSHGHPGDRGGFGGNGSEAQESPGN